MSTLLERMELASREGLEDFEAEFATCVPKLYAEWKLKYPWVRNWFRKKVRDEETVADLENRTLLKYLDHVRDVLWKSAKMEPLDDDTLKPAFRWIARQLNRHPKVVAREYMQEGRHNELVDSFYGFDKLTQEDLEEDHFRDQILAEQPGPIACSPEPVIPTDPEARTLKHPERWLNIVAQNILNEHGRKLAKEARIEERIDFAVRLNSKFQFKPFRAFVQPPTPEKIRERYLMALDQLAPVQRAAWILRRDKLLKSEEAEHLLASGSHPGSDPTSNATKARDRLFELLSDLDPLKSSRKPATKWSKEFLIALRPLRGESVHPDVQRKNLEIIRRMHAPHLPIPKTESTFLRIRDMLEDGNSYESIAQALDRANISPSYPATVWHPGAVKLIYERRACCDVDRSPLSLPGTLAQLWETIAPRRILRHDRRQARELQRISHQCGSSFKGCLNCGQASYRGICKICKNKTYSKTKCEVECSRPSGTGDCGRMIKANRKVYTSGFAVWRSYSPKSTGWTFWCYECGATDEQCWENCGAELGQER